MLLTTACHDDDDGSKIYFYYSGYDGKPTSDKLSSTNVTFYNSTLKARFISVSGGEGEYTAKSSDQDIIEDSSIEINNKQYINTSILSFTLKKEGTVIITVTDKGGNSAKLEVVATILSREFEIVESELIINNEVSETIKTEIENDIMSNNLNKNNLLVLTYNDHYQGSFRVSTAPTSLDIRLSGSFRIEDTTSKLSLYLTYNDMEHHYYSPFNIGAEAKTKTSYPPVTHSLKEDLTEYYKTKYPAENITDVSYILVFFKR